MAIYIPAETPEDWKRLLAKPERHWKTGYSARALAQCWQNADGFPREVQDVFNSSPSPLFNHAELLIALPEHKVSLPGGGNPSQNDIWVLARSNSALISIAVEGKVSERFGDNDVENWLKSASEGKRQRLEYLQSVLQLKDVPGGVRYQLLHRTASAIIEAQRFNAAHALMLVHSFSQSNEWFEDYEYFVSLYGVKAIPNAITQPVTCGPVSLYFGWIKGDERYLLA